SQYLIDHQGSSDDDEHQCGILLHESPLPRTRGPFAPMFGQQARNTEGEDRVSPSLSLERSSMRNRTVSLARPKWLSLEDWLRHPDADEFELIDGVLRPRLVSENQHEFT